MAKVYTEKEIRNIAQSALGKTFGEIQNKMEETCEYGNKENKAYFGHVFEKDVYDYEINSKSSPDFEEAGIELKVTPYKKNKNNTLSAKERLVLNIINYMTEYKNDFYSSHFWYKNNKIQIVWYLYEKNKKKEELKVTHELLYTFPKEDLPIIIKDWEFIIEKIKAGKAHELSEADTMYLGACTKGANKNTLRKQPFSEIMAMQRAFCLKTSYMTALVRRYIGNYSDVEKVLKDSNCSFNEYIKNITDKYIGRTESELKKEFNINGQSKDNFSLIINRMFGVKKGLKNAEEFFKANIVPKTIRIEESGRIKESISFPIFKFKEIINETWEESELKEELETTKYMFFIFQKENEEYIFKGFKLWNMPQPIIDTTIKDFWKRTINILRDGVKFDILDNKVYNNLPGIADNGIVHVRPHTSKSAYKLNNGYEKGDISKYADQLPNGEWMTKQCFWFNNTYIKEVISDFI